MYEYTVIDENDGNNSFTVQGANREEALEEALKEMGWWMTDGEETDGTE